MLLPKIIPVEGRKRTRTLAFKGSLQESDIVTSTRSSEPRSTQGSALSTQGSAELVSHRSFIILIR